MSRNHNGFAGLHRERFPPPSGPTTRYLADRDPVTGESVGFNVDVLNEAVGVATFPETLAERAAASPTPDFLQIKLILMVSSADPGEADGGTITWDAVTGPGTASYPFGVTETVTGEGTFTYTAQTRVFTPGQSASTILSTYLRRAPDGETYELDPTNDGIDTLFPWDEFIADPSVTAGASQLDLTNLTADDGEGHGVLIEVRPWFRDVPLSTAFMCVL